MDVLGLLANISQVVDLLVKIGVMCSIYCVDVKKAPGDVRRLLKEVDRLTAVIKELESLLQSPKGSSKLQSPSLRQAVFDLHRLLAEMVAKLDLGAKHARAVWPFKKREIHEIFATIERQKTNILLNINIEQTSVLLDVHQEIVLSKLRIADAATFDSSADGEQSFCLEGTRSHIIAQIEEWGTNSDSQSVFWLNGMAGTGKSTISRTIAQSFANKNILGASFFFKRGGGDRSGTNFLITTIAAQLVRRIPSIASRIREVLDFEPQIHEKPLGDQFQKLILDPLKNTPGCWSSSLLIVVDALDECGNEENMRTLIGIFSKAQQSNDPRLKIFLTSRPELPIRLGFEEISGKYDHLLLATVPKATIEHDIGLFMRHQLNVIKMDYNKSVSIHRKISTGWPGDDVVQQLIDSAVPLFIVAATICRFLKDRRLGGPQHQLSKILEYQKMHISGLDMTYLPILDNLIADLPLSARKEVLTRFQYLIGSIITLAQPLSIRSLADLLGISTDAIEDQLDLLHSVLGVPTDLDTPVRLLHLSFRDFLVDSEKKLNLSKYPFWVDESEAHSKLFSQCIKLLSTDGVLKEDICFLRSPGTLRSDIKQNAIDEHLPGAVQYACIYWVHHLSLSSLWICDNDQTHKFLASYLLNWLEALSIMGRITESVHMMDDLLYKLEEKNAQDIGNLIRDAKRFIQTNVATFDKAPLQIYSSALIFAPEKSIVRSVFKSSIPTWLYSLPSMQSHWDPCLATFEDQNMRDADVIAIHGGDRFLSYPGREGEMKIWDARTLSCVAIYEDVMYKSVRVSSDGAEILYISRSKGLQIMDASTRSCIAEYNGHTDEIRRAMFSADGQYLASGSKDGTLRIWSRASATCDSLLEGHRAAISDVVLSEDESKIASGSYDKSIRVWDMNTATCIAIYDGHAESIVSLIYSADETLLISVDFNGTFKVWDTSIETQWGEIESHEGAVLEVVFSPDKKTIVTTSGDRTVRLWDSTTDIPTAPFDHIMSSRGLFGFPRSIEFSADSSTILSSTDGSEAFSIKLWNAANGDCQLLSDEFTGSILSIAFSPDGTTVTSTSRDGIMRYWDTTTQKLLASFGGGTYSISSSIYTVDGTQLVLACDDGMIEILSVATGHCLDKLVGICGLANHMAFDSSAGSSLRVITNVGTLEFDPPGSATCVHARSSFSSQRAVNTIGLGLSKDGEWITWDSRNMLWLPSAFRISASDIDVAGSLLALGSRLGRLLLIGVDPSKMPVNVLDASPRPLA
ncbi:WD domain, g-beta repeat domain-containing protein [Trichoderma breve]|uniref:WD domain, g-beta repeat domain-containing protein n=1 Tax=Trichoderma breve TaxID=2034170 RepID=A0A9W9E501_9HYPO|nr:WD domain, g-beta repeat domain-containing protein [Trichoderma breve]KAJ4854901.1 WD domain, g-beta repeat domain-containing protein [Trichoderma breve]